MSRSKRQRMETLKKLGSRRERRHPSPGAEQREALYERIVTTPIPPPNPQRPSVTKLGIIAVAVLVGIPGTYAVAQSLNDPETRVVEQQPLAACPEAEAAFEQAGLKFDTISAPCPSAHEVQAQISQVQEFPVEKLRASCLEDERQGTAHDVCRQMFGPGGLIEEDPAADSVADAVPGG